MMTMNEREKTISAELKKVGLEDPACAAAGFIPVRIPIDEKNVVGLLKIYGTETKYCDTFNSIYEQYQKSGDSKECLLDFIKLLGAQGVINLLLAAIDIQACILAAINATPKSRKMVEELSEKINQTGSEEKADEQ